MASRSCLRLCHRCTRSFVLNSKVAVVSPCYSAQVQQCSTTAFRIPPSSSSSSTTNVTSLSAVSVARHRWKRLYSGGGGGKALSAHAADKEENAGEPWRADGLTASCQSTSSPGVTQRIHHDAPAATARENASHLDACPQLSALEETRDEHISTPSTQCSVLPEEFRDEEDISTVLSPDLPPPSSHSLADYVDKSETLSKLVQLGVNLWRLEQRPNVGTMLLKLDFQVDVVPRLLFLTDLGVEEDHLGRLLSHNPFILTESLENLTTRVNYLRSRKFSAQAVASMVSRAPYLLNFSVKRLDNRLGFFQQQLGLSPNNTRDVVARLPRLLCGSLEPIKETLKVCKVEFGLKDNEVQHIVLAVPKVLTANKKKLTQIFDYVHNTMHVPHHLIVKFPQVLNCKFLRVRERHLFLQYLSKAQYDPGQPGYVSLDRLVSLPDQAFCSQVASATLDDFHLFQKTL